MKGLCIDMPNLMNVNLKEDAFQYKDDVTIKGSICWGGDLGVDIGALKRFFE